MAVNPVPAGLHDHNLLAGDAHDNGSRGAAKQLAGLVGRHGLGEHGLDQLGPFFGRSSGNRLVGPLPATESVAAFGAMPSRVFVAQDAAAQDNPAALDGALKVERRFAIDDRTSISGRAVRAAWDATRHGFPEGCHLRRGRNGGMRILSFTERVLISRFLPAVGSKKYQMLNFHSSCGVSA